MGNSALVYLFGKSYDADKDAFFQDVLRRMRNGEFVDRILDFAVPKIFEALGGEALPLLRSTRSCGGMPPSGWRAIESKKEQGGLT